MAKTKEQPAPVEPEVTVEDEAIAAAFKPDPEADQAEAEDRPTPRANVVNETDTYRVTLPSQKTVLVVEILKAGETLAAMLLDHASARKFVGHLDPLVKSMED